MSFVDAARGGNELKLRKTYYYRVSETVPNVMSIRIRDQLPQGIVMRVSAASAMAGLASTLTSATMIEVRLYDAFTTENIYDSSQFSTPGSTTQGPYVILGYYTAIMGAGAAAAGQYVFSPCAPVVSRSTGNGVWKIVLYDVATGAPALAEVLGPGFSVALDVRAGGPIVYAN